MFTKEEIVKALDTTYNSEVETGFLDWYGKFLVSPQFPEGRSIWAQHVGDGHMKPYDILWAFTKQEDGSKEWLAMRLQLKEKTYYLNLRSSKDRALLKDLESKTKF